MSGINLYLAILFLGSITALIDVGPNLIGRTIHIQSLRYPSRWFDAHDSKDMRFTGSAEKNVYALTWTQFKVHKKKIND